MLLQYFWYISATKILNMKLFCIEQTIYEPRIKSQHGSTVAEWQQALKSQAQDDIGGVSNPATVLGL